MATMTQPDPKPMRPDGSVDPDDLYEEEEPRGRSWWAILSVLLALALTFVGYQWHQATGRAGALAAEVSTLRADAESRRLRAEDAQRQVADLQKRVTALGAEREQLGERLAALERASRERAVAAREAGRERKAVAKEPGRPGATPVAVRPPPAKKSR